VESRETENRAETRCTSSVRYAEDSGLALITLAASASGNRINAAALRALGDALTRAESSAENLADGSESQNRIRFVIIRSNGRVFCHGMDFSFFLENEGGGAAAEEAVHAYSELLARMRSFPKLIIALIDGEVKAGGVGIVAAADIVLASARSTFQLSEVFLGLLPANVLPFLAERVGANRAAYLALSARTCTAAEARSQGLVDEVFADDTLEKEARAYIRTLLRADPYALARGKRFAREIRTASLGEARALAERTLLEMAARSEVRDAISAFEEGGLPSWSARLKLAENLWIGEENE